MILKSKICGVSDINTLEYIVNHNYPPQFIGFIVNYPKSKRYVNIKKLKEIFEIDKKKSLYVAVLVDPEKKILEEIKNLPFDYYHLLLKILGMFKIINYMKMYLIFIYLIVKDTKKVCHSITV